MVLKQNRGIQLLWIVLYTQVHLKYLSKSKKKCEWTVRPSPVKNIYYLKMKTLLKIFKIWKIKKLLLQLIVWIIKYHEKSIVGRTAFQTLKLLQTWQSDNPFWNPIRDVRVSWK